MAEPFTIHATFRNPDGQEFILSGTVTVEPKPLPAPVVTSTEPVSLPFAGGKVVTFYGEHFQQGMQVLFGERPATAVVVSEDGTSVTVTSPSFE